MLLLLGRKNGNLSPPCKRFGKELKGLRGWVRGIDSKKIRQISRFLGDICLVNLSSERFDINM